MKDRRKILKGMAIGSTWATPLVSSVMLPAHAQTSVITQPTGQFLLTFTANNFIAFSGADNPPPTDPVAGEIIYQTAEITDDTTAPIDSIISIDLTLSIDLALTLFTYDVAGVAVNDVGNIIGGSTLGATAIANETNDFRLTMFPDDKGFSSFNYTVLGNNTIWRSITGSTTVTPILA